MTQNPVVNAFLAAGYIGVVVLVINFLATNGADKPETLLIPMVMLSLFVLSAAVMGYLFLYEPLKLYFDERRQEAVTLFLKTLATFAVITAVFVVILLYVR